MRDDVKMDQLKSGSLIYTFAKDNRLSRLLYICAGKN